MSTQDPTTDLETSAGEGHTPRRVAQAVVVGHGEVRDAREKHELVGTRVAREGRGHGRRPPTDVQPMWPPDETQPPKSPNKWAPAGELHHGHPKWDSTLMCRPSIRRVSRASALYTLLRWGL